MVDLLISILGIYLFVALGAFAKWKFAEDLQERSLILVSVYLLQPFLTFWGLTARPIEPDVFEVSFWYIGIVAAIFLLMILPARALFAEKKKRAIFLVASLVGNTGNLGIPLGIAIFGEASVPYTTMINLANVFFVNILGVYIYSSGTFSPKQSVMNVVKMPILWSALAAIAVNIFGLQISGSIEANLKLGAYASIVVQLLLFGIYLSQVRPEHLDRRLLGSVGSVKFVLLPLAGWVAMRFTALPPMVQAVLLLELMTPLAVANVNFAALFHCRPKDVAALVFVSSLFFLLYFASIWPLVMV
ncbi:AEC family transporter [Hydrogenimonas urashimensis]|uniref:AEC family transporter n=1 Tax=Hydrogenimonas urashimensis TaxID=2740515 RepID=UPI00191615CC|nr:AEC family transporter [Hydrogenimonas urashimensis]